MKILIAEDDPISAMALEALLIKQGHEVKTCATGGEAWEDLQNEVYPIVILDWMMPEMDGLEVCRNIRKHLKSPYRCIIMLTAKQAREDRVEALHAGVDVFLTKPLDCEEMIARLQMATRILTMER